MGADMVDRLALPDERGHDLLDPGDVILGHSDAGTALREQFLVLGLGRPRLIELFLECTVEHVLAAVTYIGRLQERPAVVLFELVT